MNNQVTLPQNEIKCRTPILVLLVISLAVNFISFALGNIITFTTISCITSCFLLVLYVLVLYKKLKATFVVPLIFIFSPFTSAILFFPMFGIFFIMAIINAFNGLSNKIFVLILFALGVFIEAEKLVGSTHSYVYTNPFQILATIVFYTALLVFCLKNKIPSALLPIQVKLYAKNEKYEEAFNLLKKEYESGFMSEEEYQIQRTKILNKV